MITIDEVRAALPAKLQYLAEYATRIANIVIEADASEQHSMVMYLQTAATMTAPPTPAAFRKAFIVAASLGFSFELENQIKAIQLPETPVVDGKSLDVIDYGERHADDISRLKKMRIGDERNDRLADAAELMENWFHWVKSGPRVPGREGEVGAPYGPKVLWDRTYTSEGVEEHDAKINHFAFWLEGPNAPEPDRDSHMNCWEAVFFSAFKATLVNKEWLTTLHRNAARGFEKSDKKGKGPAASDKYFAALNTALLLYDTVPYEPRAGLIPRRGDILFFDDNTHVAISLGPNENEDALMSLWDHNNGRFTRLTLDHPHLKRHAIRFRPCPFP